jgi:hypothetical protein
LVFKFSSLPQDITLGGKRQLHFSLDNAWR